ncbi:MAG TPA: nucleotidyltransferase family protein [Bacteroidales bacterium]|nr:nucleotidyltransferase family protein [Bacteroidales bacterium]
MTAEGSELNYITDLLIALSRVDFTPDERRRAEDLCRAVTDWSSFAGLAIRHGVAALVWRNLDDMQLAHQVKENERKRLEGIMLKTIARVTYITAVAAEIIQALEKSGIRVLLLKGLALEHSVYRSRGLRQMSDADLLVSPADALKARDVIESLGFVSRPMKSSLYHNIILDFGNHLPEMHRGGISVDLHHRLFGARAGGLTEMALRMPVNVTAGGMTCNILPPQINFLSLVMHMQKHEDKGEFQLRLYCDIYLLLLNESGKILTDSLVDEARMAGIEDEVKAVLYLMKVIYDFYVPEKFTAGIKPELINTDRFLVNLEDPGYAEPVTPSEVYRRNLSAINGIKGKLIFIAGDLFPSVSFMKKRYGRQSVLGALLCYPHRMGKLFVILKALRKGHVR